jgi:hypothetical protein
VLCLFFWFTRLLVLPPLSLVMMVLFCIGM